ncbi:MAG: Fosmidomycin resistance protein [Xanthobacteraceae bacterium]|nr:Fosmidomycin resistance protein [Xanthobacteraceae bacterium]
MTETAIRLPRATRHENRLIGSISAAHFVSHYYFLLLPPLFLFVRDEYQVSYTELGLALTAFNVASAVLQTPAGFLIDRVGPRAILIAGLLIETIAFATAGLVNSFWVLVAMFAVAGVGNTVYHPADYAILSERVSAERIGQAFSVHTFAGFLGSAVAPVSLLTMQNLFGWRGAFLGAAALGLLVAALLLLQRDPEGDAAHAAAKAVKAAEGSSASDWRLLMAPAIIINLLFFILLAVSNAGLNNYTVVALEALYGTSPVVANAALSALLFMGALGVLAGGVLAGRTSRHALVTCIGLTVTGLASVLVGAVNLGPAALFVTMGVGGFFMGVIMPSRDMIVREMTPPGAFGRVFGFITTGFNIGGMAAPVMFGLMMDHGQPAAIYWSVAACSLMSVVAVVACSRSTARAA